MKKLYSWLIIAALLIAVSFCIFIYSSTTSHTKIDNPTIKENSTSVTELEPVNKSSVEQKADIEPKNIIKEGDVIVVPQYLSADEVSPLILPSIVDTEDFHTLLSLRFSYVAIERAVMNTYVNEPSLFTEDSSKGLIKSCLKQLNEKIINLKEQGEPYDYRTGICVF